MRVEPYLSLGGRCEAALAFYQSAIGAELMFLQRFREAPLADGEKPIGPPDGVMHATIRIGESLVHASDGDCRELPIGGIHLSIQVDDAEQGRLVFDALAEGGEVTMPFGKTFWTEGFGMLVDRFGVAWMVNVAR